MGVSASVQLPQTPRAPAFIRWTYVRSVKVYPNLRPTAENSPLGAVLGIGPVLSSTILCFQSIQREGKTPLGRKTDQTFHLILLSLARMTIF